MNNTFWQARFETAPTGVTDHIGEVRNADRMNQHGMRVLPRSESPWGNLTPQNLASEEGPVSGPDN